jgi:hypothetical protein
LVYHMCEMIAVISYVCRAWLITTPSLLTDYNEISVVIYQLTINN